MTTTTAAYTTQLQAGLGMIDETRVLLDLWQEGTDAPALCRAALESGRFPTMSARRLRNLVSECFAPRYLVDDASPALLLKRFTDILATRELEQLLFLYTCRANEILADFVRDVYWHMYSAGRDSISNEHARDFVTRATQDGKTSTQWSPTTIRRVASYLTGCCADFGLLEGGAKSVRKIVPYRIEPRTVAVLAYELHFSGYGDNRMIAAADWGLFGLARDDALDELKRLSLKNLFIVQSAGTVTRIGWQCNNIEELAHVLAQS
jgi:hypothetical protein